MEMHNFGRRFGLGSLALIAMLALLIGTLGTAGALGSGGDNTATAAKKKKKCKKGFKLVKKNGKKKCKRKPSTVPPLFTPAPVPKPPTPVPSTLRATLTWNTTADLDLWAWDTSGSDFPPSTAYSADDTDGFGPETFTDLLSPSTRHFTFGVCTFNAVGSTNFTLSVRYGDGTTDVWTQADFGGPFTADGDWATVEDDPPSYDPGDPAVTGWCP